MQQMRYLNLRFLIGRVEDYGDDMACSPTSGYDGSGVAEVNPYLLLHLTRPGFPTLLKLKLRVALLFLFIVFILSSSR